MAEEDNRKEAHKKQQTLVINTATAKPMSGSPQPPQVAVAQTSSSNISKSGWKNPSIRRATISLFVMVVVSLLLLAWEGLQEAMAKTVVPAFGDLGSYFVGAHWGLQTLLGLAGMALVAAVITFGVFAYRRYERSISTEVVESADKASSAPAQSRIPGFVKKQAQASSSFIPKTQQEVNLAALAAKDSKGVCNPSELQKVLESTSSATGVSQKNSDLVKLYKAALDHNEHQDAEQVVRHILTSCANGVKKGGADGQRMVLESELSPILSIENAKGETLRDIFKKVDYEKMLDMCDIIPKEENDNIIKDFREAFVGKSQFGGPALFAAVSNPFTPDVKKVKQVLEAKKGLLEKMHGEGAEFQRSDFNDLLGITNRQGKNCDDIFDAFMQENGYQAQAAFGSLPPP